MVMDFTPVPIPISKSQIINYINTYAPAAPKTGIIVAAADASAIEKIGADYQCSGINDDVIIQQAIESLSPNGGRIWLTNGHYNISSSITIDVPGISILGKSENNTIIRSKNTTQDVFDINSPYCIIENLSIDESTVVKTAGYSFNIVVGFVSLKNIKISSAYFGVLISGANNVVLYNILITALNTCISLTNNAYNLYLSQIQYSGVTGFNLSGVNNSVFEHFYPVGSTTNAIIIYGTSGLSVYNCNFINCSFSNSSIGVLIWADTSNSFYSLKFSDCIARDNSVNGIKIYNTAGPNGGVILDKCEIRHNALQGIVLGNGSANLFKDIIISNCVISNNGYSGSGNTADAIFVDKSILNLQIVNNYIGPYQGDPISQRYAVNLSDPSIANVQIIGNNMMGNIGVSNSFVFNASSSIYVKIKNNLGQNPLGKYLPQPAYPASSTWIQNTTGYTCRVFARGGSLSQIQLKDIALVVQLTNPDSGGYANILLDVGEWVQLIYTVAGLWFWVAL